jgi:hypothetical protein
MVMDATGKADREDPDTELRWESVRMARAKRRLVEHELTQRRTLLLLTVMLAIVAIVTALTNGPYVGGAFGGAAILPGLAVSTRRSSDR